MELTGTNSSIGLIALIYRRPYLGCVENPFASYCVSPAWWPSAERSDPIPSRTRPSNASAPMVLCLKTWESRSLPGLPSTINPLYLDRLRSSGLRVTPKTSHLLIYALSLGVLPLFDFLTFCAAALYLMQRSKISCFVALLGRFLPRLGPLVSGGPFSFFSPQFVLCFSSQTHFGVTSRKLSLARGEMKVALIEPVAQMVKGLK